MRTERTIVLVAAGFAFVAVDALRSEDREYELRAGSIIIDACRDCDRPVFEEPIEGTFRLRVVNYGDVITQYEILDLDVRSTAGGHTVLGMGTYDTWYGDPGTHQMALELEVDGVPDVQLSSEVVENPVPWATAWPAIDIAVNEPGDRDPFHVYTVRIVAAPAATMVRYELLEGSVLIDDCTICGRRPLSVPIEGTFLLGEIDGGPSPIIGYRVDAVDFRGKIGDSEWLVTGRGYYRQGGEVALLQGMQLEVRVGDTWPVILESTRPEVPVQFPAIDVDLSQSDPVGTTVYSLRIVAKPSEAVVSIPFRRAEANADGQVDISDAISILGWLFTGGAAPGCLEAADANDDGSNDLSDAVYTLLYLFQGGAVPPAPGPDSCGTVPEPHLGCIAYPPCAG